MQGNLKKYSRGSRQNAVEPVLTFTGGGFFLVMEEGCDVTGAGRKTSVGAANGMSSKKHCCMTSGLLNQEKRTYNQYLITLLFSRHFHSALYRNTLQRFLEINYRCGYHTFLKTCGENRRTGCHQSASLIVVGI